MVTCDIFDFTVVLQQLEEPTVFFRVLTDLPINTRVIACCERRYIDDDGNDCVWSGYSEALMITEAFDINMRGLEDTFSVYNSDRDAAATQDWINVGDGLYYSSRVSDELTITLTVGGRQRLREFGHKNCNLKGKMVVNSGGINIVRASATVVSPIDKRLLPQE